MIVTDDFVLLNFPKTGSSFVREAIKQVYAPPAGRLRRWARKLHLSAPGYEEIYVPKLDESRYRGIEDQHGTWRQIPMKHRNKTVVSITRNPVQRYQSAYQYGWWKRYPPGAVEELKRRFPGFPDIDFSSYYEMLREYSCRDRLARIDPKVQLGLHSIQFIQFYCRDPETVLKRIDQEYIDTGRIRDDIAPIRFMEQATLTTDLKALLLSFGRNAAALEAIDKLGRVNASNPVRAAGAETQSVVSREMVSTILKEDQLIFRFFPSYGSSV